MSPEGNPTSKLERDFVRTVLALSAKQEVKALLVVSDLLLSNEELKGRPVKKKLVYAVTDERTLSDAVSRGARAVLIPPYEYARLEKIKVAVVSGLAAGVLKEGQNIIAVTGARMKPPDTLVRLRIGAGLDEAPSLEGLDLSEEFSSQVVEAFIDIALRIGHDGFEGHPIGTLICIGDSIKVMEKSNQLTLNPFQGISEAERNVLDPRIREAIRNFSVLDGAFVAREDGVIMAAGRYLQAHSENVRVPLGLGARHTAAAAITAETRCIAITVSQTSGSVRVFRGGEIALELHQPARRM